MKFLHADNSTNNVEQINTFIEQGKKVFILVYIEGCGPCNATRPEWGKIKSALENQYKNNDDVVIVDVDKDLLPSLKHIGNVDGFPTIKYISNNGNNVESYEDSSIREKDRSVDSFVNWIESKITDVQSETPKSSPQQLYNRLKSASRKRSYKRASSSSRKMKGGKRKTHRRHKKRNMSSRRK